MTRCLPFALLLLLAACASEAKYQAMLQSWVGGSERELVAAWGPPDSVYEHEGLRYLTWTTQYQNYLPGTPPTYRSHVVGDRVYTRTIGGSPGLLVNNRCKTTFTLEADRIVAWRAEGNACRS